MFKVGDLVECIEAAPPYSYLEVGKHYVVKSIKTYTGRDAWQEIVVERFDKDYYPCDWSWDMKRFRLVGSYKVKGK